MQGGRRDLRRSAERAVTRVPGGELHHAFSAGAHYDPANTSFGPLVLHDEVRLQPGAGFEDHPHAGVAVVTHVVSGALRHRDALGADAVLGPGDTGVMRAGTALVHAEHAGPDGVHYVQAFLLDDAPPAHVVHRGADRVEVAGATLRVLHLAVGERTALRGPRVHVHVVSGALDGLAEGDALRAGDGAELRCVEPALVLAWVLPG